jgi:hypothetical protein
VSCRSEPTFLAHTSNSHKPLHQMPYYGSGQANLYQHLLWDNAMLSSVIKPLIK